MSVVLDRVTIRVIARNKTHLGRRTCGYFEYQMTKDQSFERSLIDVSRKKLSIYNSSVAVSVA